MTQDLRVLIVDDDFHVADLHATYVDSTPGFTALPPAGTAEQARRSAAAEQPDLVLLDVYLPDADGLDLLTRLDADALILSAAAEAATVRRAFRRGAVGYLIKPFTEEDLTRRLRAYARYRRLLPAEHTVDQDTVERAVRALNQAQSAGTTRTRSATESAILDALEADVQQSTMTIARRVGVSRATAQRYLSALVDDGSAAIHLRYGTTGRPEHRYSLVADS